MSSKGPARQRVPTASSEMSGPKEIDTTESWWKPKVNMTLWVTRQHHSYYSTKKIGKQFLFQTDEPGWMKILCTYSHPLSFLINPNLASLFPAVKCWYNRLCVSGILWQMTIYSCQCHWYTYISSCNRIN